VAALASLHIGIAFMLQNVAFFSLSMVCCFAVFLPAPLIQRVLQRNPVAPPETRPSVLLITIDTLRADHLGVYGYTRNTSPHLDALAREATVFDYAYTYWPKTRGSFVAMLTGRRDAQTGYDKAHPSLLDFNPTLASVLQGAGYRTAAVVDNGNVAAAHGYAKGFATYRETWQENGEGFAVMYRFLARIAPFHALDGRIRLRWPFTGLAGAERVPGSVAFVAVMLGSVLFDGYSRTTTWQDLAARVESPFVIDQPTLGELVVTLLSLGGLLTGVLLVALAYQAACALARWTVNAPRSLTGDFLHSLVPIAFVYMLAHYFTLFVLQGQFAVPLLSDPLGRGWNLFGTAHVVPNLTVVPPNTTWYVQVGALVAGHVAGLAVAHDRAITIFPDRRDALRSQYALLALMVLYTVGGLWVLSRG